MANARMQDGENLHSEKPQRAIVSYGDKVKMEWMKIAQRVYERSKKVITYLTLIFTFVVFYGGNFLGSFRDRLLPAALIIAFGILLESTFSINDKLQDKLGIMEFDSIRDAVPKMVDIIKRGRGRAHTIKIIASSGGTTTNIILPEIVKKAPGSIDIQILMINPQYANTTGIPEHWMSEAKVTIDRLGKLCQQQNINVRCYFYDYIPCVHGVMIDDKHLFLGFFVWDTLGNHAELSGSQQPHTYYRRTQMNENMFRLFQGWFDESPKQDEYPCDVQK